MKKLPFDKRILQIMTHFEWNRRGSSEARTESV